MRFNEQFGVIDSPPLTSVSYSCASGDGLGSEALHGRVDDLHVSMEGCSRGSVRISQGNGSPHTFLSDKQVGQLIIDLRAIRETSRAFYDAGGSNLERRRKA